MGRAEPDRELSCRCSKRWEEEGLGEALRRTVDFILRGWDPWGWGPCSAFISAGRSVGSLWGGSPVMRHCLHPGKRGWQAGAWSGWQQQRGESVSGPEGGGTEGPLGHLRGSLARACGWPVDEECHPEPAGFPSPSCMAGPGPAVSVCASDTTPTWPGHSSACRALQCACWERPSCWQPGAGRG